MKIKEVLDKTVKFFHDKGFESPRLDTELILAHVLKIERIQLYVKFDQPMAEAELNAARELVKRRAQGEPVAYILGEKWFYGHNFKVGPGVLIPRPETEHLVEEAVEWTKKNPMDQYVVVDLGCGSGCIGLTVLREVPQAVLFAVDISDKALEFTKANAERLEVTDRVHFIKSDAGDSETVISKIREQGFDKIQLLLSNPPYIAENDSEVEKNVKAFEPSEALFAQENGLEKLKLWSKIYLPYLAEPSLMLMEMGYQQGPQMKKYFEELEFDAVSVKKDLSGHDRVIRGENI